MAFGILYDGGCYEDKNLGAYLNIANDPNGILTEYQNPLLYPFNLTDRVFEEIGSIRLDMLDTDFTNFSEFSFRLEICDLNDPSLKKMQLVDGNNTSSNPNNPIEYDYTSAAAFWTFAFSTVLGLWFVSKNIGIVIDAIKKF